MQKMFNSPNRQLSMPTMKGQSQRKMWSDKVSQGDHSKDGKGAKTESSLKLSADKKRCFEFSSQSLTLLPNEPVEITNKIQPCSRIYYSRVY
jgi:hypothetical protein